MPAVKSMIMNPKLKSYLCLCISKCSRLRTDKLIKTAEREKEISHITTCGAKSVSTNQFTNMINLLFKVAVLVAGLLHAHFSKISKTIKVFPRFITVQFLIFEYELVKWPQMIPRHGHRSIWIEWPFSTLKLIQIELEVILLSWWWKFCHSHCLLSKLNQH